MGERGFGGAKMAIIKRMARPLTVVMAEAVFGRGWKEAERRRTSGVDAAVPAVKEEPSGLDLA